MVAEHHSLRTISCTRSLGGDDNTASLLYSVLLSTDFSRLCDGLSFAGLCAVRPPGCRPVACPAPAVRSRDGVSGASREAPAGAHGDGRSSGCRSACIIHPSRCHRERPCAEMQCRVNGRVARDRCVDGAEVLVVLMAVFRHTRHCRCCQILSGPAEGCLQT